MELGVHRDGEVGGDRVPTHGHHGVAVGGRRHEDPGDDLLVGPARVHVGHDLLHVVRPEPVDDGAVALSTGHAQHALAQCGHEDLRLLLRDDAELEAR